MANTSKRMLRLLSLLQARGSWGGDELAARLEVSPRTLRRDVERLRELGYPVAASRGVAGGYRLGAGTSLPPLLLEDDEAIAVALGLRTLAVGAIDGVEQTSVQALSKLQQLLPARLRRRVDALTRVTATPAPPGGPTVSVGTLTTLALACRDHERVRFDHAGRGPTAASSSPSRPSASSSLSDPAAASSPSRPSDSSASSRPGARDGAATRRHVEPHRLVALGRRWYLLAWDLDRGDWRSFRIDRVTRATATGTRFAPRRLPDADAAAYVEASIAAARPARHAVDVLVHAPAATVEREVARWGTVEPLADDRCRLRLQVDDLGWPAFFLASLDADFEVIAPPELTTHLHRVATRLASARTVPAP